MDSDSEDGPTVDLGSDPLQEALMMVTTTASKIREAIDREDFDDIGYS